MSKDCPKCKNSDFKIRIHRDLWMKFIPFTRLYKCTHCYSKFLYVMFLDKSFITQEKKITYSRENQ